MSSAGIHFLLISLKSNKIGALSAVLSDYRKMIFTFFLERRCNLSPNVYFTLLDILANTSQK